MAPKRPSIKLLGNERTAKPRRRRPATESPAKNSGKTRRVITLPEKPPEPPAPAKPRLVVQIHGGAIYVGGNPGNKGGGRPPDQFKRMLAACVSHDEVVKAVMTVLVDPDHEHWSKALNYATRVGYPELAAASKRPPDATDQTDDVLIAKLRTIYERITRAIHHEEMSPAIRRLHAAEEIAAIDPPDDA